MRNLLVTAAILPIVAALAACQSEEDARNTFRQASIDGCVNASRNAPSPPAMAGFDWNRLCTCATDRIMEGKSASELARLQPGGPGQMEAVQQCVTEMQGGAPAPAPATTG